ncbi:hypothetical protein B0T24DRAFT_390467 [Lasiosphaeria ovina]|uniref:Uncharacterized protein n=1 Tax=Lasiosphaeria ovina TaxID=92902 RepID=A0AAE0K0R8_9PEZI|nr:hypothetical protein B0T24DRAFT_390467 [Lasiosphaeria ovina]
MSRADPKSFFLFHFPFPSPNSPNRRHLSEEAVECTFVAPLTYLALIYIPGLLGLKPDFITKSRAPRLCPPLFLLPNTSTLLTTFCAPLFVTSPPSVRQRQGTSVSIPTKFTATVTHSQSSRTVGPVILHSLRNPREIARVALPENFRRLESERMWKSARG